ncbi:MAG: cobalamin biosynthesis protein CobD [Spirochaetes bacterium]|nr:cobalamin biosynthesis protein CobD [Spirochaetota bacterium]
MIISVPISGLYSRNLVFLTAALFIDFIFGDPVFAFHPVRLIGNLITKTEKILRTAGFSEKSAGMTGTFSTLIITCGIFLILRKSLSPYPVAGKVLSIVTIYFTIALKDLTIHGIRVKKALSSGSLKDARRRVSFLISRDTGHLGEKAIVKCTIESISENSCDSVIAPLFWGLLFGVPGALAYRVINTLDAMWGYKTEKYINFGRTAALLDDAVNFIPARITGVLICLAAPLSGGNILKAFKIMIRDHAKLKSPNAGYSEAAMAGALGIKLSGAGIYFGEVVHKPEIGDDVHTVDKKLISASIGIVYVTVVLFLLFAWGTALLL